MPHRQPLFTRRDALIRGGAGFGALALAELFGASIDSQLARAAVPPRPHHRPTAKNIIFLFMEGGPSHIDTFDPKPKLNELAGQPLPESYGRVITAMGERGAPLLASQRKWKQQGESGLWVSDWLPHLAECADDLAVVRSCWCDGLNHVGSVCQMNTGSTLAGRPSLGSWVSYGLGTENNNLPSFVVLLDREAIVSGGPRNWGSGFLPGMYDGTQLQTGDEPIPNLHSPESVSDARQRRKLDLLGELNRENQAQHPLADALEARIRSYELAFRMQAEAPEAVDLTKETAETRTLYGLDDEQSGAMGRNCLLARRLVERGVRFVQVYHGAGSRWDAHSNIESNHTTLCREMDLPVAGLLKDLKRRGLLDETLVVWGGEFGRTPMSEKGNGRDHNPTGFTMWMAGGGVRGGQAIGTTDDLGLHAVEDRLHIHDLHATMLDLLGVDHSRLVYLHKGRPERPTLNEGGAYRQIRGV
ncbi:MAG: DUF1501 domain-containing protein [Pirellulales bacterium]